MMSESYKNNSNVKIFHEFKCKMLVGNINIRYYIFNKTENFEIDLDEINPDNICLSRTWMAK